MKRGAISSFVVSRVESGQSLQVYLASKFALSKRAAKNLLDQKAVWVNRRCVWMAHHLLRQGDTVEVQASVSKGREKASAATPKIRVLFEDEDYLIANKPSGVLSSGGGGSAVVLLRQQTEQPGLNAVHRLDRNTTGCLLLAKNDSALEAAIAIFKTRRVTKIYHAIVSGRFERMVSTVCDELDQARAVSHIRRESCSKDASFLKIRIETGRTHQIRRHMASLRHPVLGDREHGLKTARDPRLLTVPRQMLHASSLELPHPLKRGVVLKAHSPLPADFRRCLKLFDMGK